jgi:hypothetical protein
MLALHEFGKTIAMSQYPDVLQKRIEYAMLPSGWRDRDAIDKLLGVLPIDYWLTLHFSNFSKFFRYGAKNGPCLSRAHLCWTTSEMPAERVRRRHCNFAAKARKGGQILTFTAEHFWGVRGEGMPGVSDVPKSIYHQSREPIRMLRRPKAPDPRTFAQFYAAARRASGLQLAKYVLCPFGLALYSVGDIVVDQTIALVQGHTDGDIYLCPLRGKPQPTGSVAWYYADCIAYEHDIPVIVLPTSSDFERFGYRYAHSGHTNSDAR